SRLLLRGRHCGILSQRLPREVPGVRYGTKGPDRNQRIRRNEVVSGYSHHERPFKEQVMALPGLVYLKDNPEVSPPTGHSVYYAITRCRSQQVCPPGEGFTPGRLWIPTASWINSICRQRYTSRCRQTCFQPCRIPTEPGPRAYPVRRPRYSAP